MIVGLSMPRRVVQLEGKKVTLLHIVLASVGLAVLAQAATAAEITRHGATAAETIALARHSCGHELSEPGEALVVRVRAARAFVDERTVLATLWRQTFLCNPAYAGENCMAARWQLCQRAYAEYGPEGIVAKGLIRAIVKK